MVYILSFADTVYILIFAGLFPDCPTRGSKLMRGKLNVSPSISQYLPSYFFVEHNRRIRQSVIEDHQVAARSRNRGAGLEV